MLPKLLAALLLTTALVPAAAHAAPPQEVDENGNHTHDTTWETDATDDNGDPIVINTGDPDPDTDSCTYKITGRLVVKNPMVAGIADGDPLKGVEISVSGATKYGWYTEWADVHTGADGKFSVTHHECDQRWVEVQARFDTGSLHVSGPSSPSWYQLYETSDVVNPKTIALGDSVFGSGQSRTDAQTWSVYRRLIDHMASIGHPYLNKVTVHNPATLTSGISATDPILQDIHIDPAQTADLTTMVHEGGHAWMYPHVTGEGCLTFTALLSGGTHAAQEDSCVAFNEGFAEFYASKAIAEMVADGELSTTAGSVAPWNRAKPAQKWSADTLGKVAKSDRAWEDVFRVLTTPDITADAFGRSTDSPGLVGDSGATGCSGQPKGLDALADALTVIGSDMDVSGVSVASFLGRADNRLSGFDAADATAYMDAIDPARTTEPHTAYGC